MPTPLCRTLGLTAPVVQAPIGPIAASPRLAAAVADAGALGMLSLTWLPPAAIPDRIHATRALTDGAFGVNFVLTWPQHERIAACAGEVPVVSTFLGDPAPYVEAIHAGGALHMHTVGSAADARSAVAAGVDVIVAQGWEAGGHLSGQVATLPLVPAVVDAVHPVPVVAAGGIADGRGVVAVLALGADAAWVGTRFLMAAEASPHPEWQRRLAAADETATAYSTLFDGGWPEPDAPVRTLRNSTVERGPDARERIGMTPDGRPVHRNDAEPPHARTTGEIEAMALYAGQGVALVRDVQPAAEIVADLVSAL
jgi:NAD(P)H-dependent flavin oxidoreductase YrpB (nitropropane dioxygenase family)